MTKDERQSIAIDIFEKEKGHCTFEMCTAFGKTITAIKIIKKMRLKDPTRHITVIVPRIHLKDHWEAQLALHGITDFVQVYVINTAVKRKITTCFLILDEIHRYASDTFAEVFEAVTYKFILGLTATIERSDKKHKLLEKFAPVGDKVTLEEARLNGWIAEFNEYNLAIELPPLDRIKYTEYEEQYRKSMDTFMNDFGLMTSCASSIRPTKITSADGTVRYIEPKGVELARKYGWTGNSPGVAYAALLKKEKNFWGGSLMHTYHPQKMVIYAMNGIRAMQKMRTMINKHPAKIAMAVEVMKAFPMRAITFAENTSVADEMTKAINAARDINVAIAYHTKIKIADPTTGKLMNSKKSCSAVLNLVKDGMYEIICTAKALNEGADLPEVQLGIKTAGTSSSIAHTQLRGRIVRKFGTKEAVMVNLYFPNTSDQRWLAKAQKYDGTVYWVETIQEIIDNELTF